MCDLVIDLHLKSKKDKTNYSDLFELAIKKGSVSFISFLLKKNPPDLINYFPKIFTYHTYNTETIKMLANTFHSYLKKRKEFEKLSEKGKFSALFLASICEDYESLSLLENIGVNIHQKNDWDNHNILSMVSCFGSYKMFRYLVSEKNMDVSFVHPHLKMNLLHFSVHHGNFDVVRYILDRNLVNFVATVEGKSTNVFHLSASRPLTKVKKKFTFFFKNLKKKKKKRAEI